MRKRPLCVALVIVVVILFLWRLLGEENLNGEYKGGKKYLTCQVTEISGQSDQISLTAEDVTEGEIPFCFRVKLYNGSREALFSKIKIGNIISVYGEVVSFSKPGNPGQFNEYQYYSEQKISYRVFVQSLTIKDSGYNKIKQWLHEIRGVFFRQMNRVLPEREAGIMSAMLLGEKCALTEEIKELYQENGIAHILAISGLHISVIGAGLFFLLRRFIMPMRVAAAVTGTVLFLYGELTGFPIATQRAVLMMLCVLGARCLGRRYDLLSALSLSALIQLFLRPGVLFQSGFLLSYGTVLGIALFVEPFTGAGWEKSRVWKAVSGSLGIYLVTLPVLLYSYYEITTYSVFVNIMILPFISLLLILSVAGAGISLFSLFVGRFLFGTVYYILRYYEFVCRMAAHLPFTLIVTGCPAWWQISGYYAGLIGWCVWRKRKKEKKGLWILILAFLLLIMPVTGTGRGKLSITNMDVGQGDCACIRFAGKTILVDGGSTDVEKVAKYRISKFLKYYGIRTIDYIFITHSDSDHTSGIMEMVEEEGHMGLQIGEVILPKIKKTDESYRQIEKSCAKADIKVKKMGKGDWLYIGALTVRCLHPYDSYDWSEVNDYSLVLELTYGKFRGILTGDLGQEGEELLNKELLNTDYLKVGHHGSESASSEAFLKRLRPVISVISAGEKNRYGHPAEEVVKRLKDTGSKVYCTIDRGAVTVETDGEKTEVKTYK